MKSSKELFDLINSLDKAEKRNFKLYLARYDRDKESNESILFDILNKMKKLDENKIQSQFEEKAKHKSIAYVKNKLMGSLLDFLADYQADNNIKAKLGKLITQINILRKKKQIALALKQTEKGLKLANETYNHVYITLFLEIKMSLFFYDSHFNEALFNDVISNLNRAVKNLQTDTQYNILNKTLVAYHNNYFKINKKNINNKIKKITQTNYWNDEKLANTFLSQSFLYDAKALFYHNRNEHNKTIMYYKKILKSFKEKQNFLKNEPLVYISYAFNYITLLNANEKYEEAFQEIEKIFQFQANPKIKLHPIDKKGFQAIYYITYLDLLTNSDNFKNLNNFLRKEKKNIEKALKEDETRRLSFYCYIAINYLVFGNYKELRDSILKFESDISYTTGPRIFTLKVMGLIAHYELENITLLNSKFNALYYSSRKEELNKLDSLIIKLFRIINNNTNSDKTLFHSKELLKHINNLPNNSTLYYKGIKYWIENKFL